MRNLHRRGIRIHPYTGEIEGGLRTSGGFLNGARIIEMHGAIRRAMHLAAGSDHGARVFDDETERGFAEDGLELPYGYSGG